MGKGNFSNYWDLYTLFTKIKNKIKSVSDSIPTVNDGTLTIKRNGTNVTTFTANQAGTSTADITVPTKTSELTNNSNFVADSSYVHTDNNYTTAEKTKLSGIASGAEANVQSDWNQTTTTADDYIKNKPTIPTALSDLTADATHRLVTDTEKTTWNGKATPTDITNAINALDVSSVGGSGKYISAISETDGKISATATNFPTIPAAANNAGSHNSTYRGESLGSNVTAEQYTAIANGTFDDMYIGDYWTIGGVNYRIAHFDYWLNTGDTNCTTHHVVLVPDTSLYTAKINDSMTTTGAYVGSKMYTTNLKQAKNTINNAFGTSHILKHRVSLANAMKSIEDLTSPTYEISYSYYDSTVELMNERMVYGADVFHNAQANNGEIPANVTFDKSQLALFVLDQSRICSREYWWLRDAVSATAFAIVRDDGGASRGYVNQDWCVRPIFAIKA